jgi:SWI/SNF-related matrix-associated actin-dependent regulator of chromatin subfamily A member 5
MLRMYHAGMSCVLADEMGLGKTLQTIALLGTLKKDYKLRGAHLVVVPMSVLSNWLSEFKKFCPLLKVVRYHSSDLSEKQRLRYVDCLELWLYLCDVATMFHHWLVH